MRKYGYENVRWEREGRGRKYDMKGEEEEKEETRQNGWTGRRE